MAIATGYTTLDLAAVTTMDEVFDALLSLIPNPEVAPANQPLAPAAAFFDEMSPAVAAHLRAELEAAKVVANDTEIV